MRLEHDEFSCPPSPTGLDGGHPVADSERLNAALELSRKIAASGLQNDAFLLANEDQLVANCQWAQDFPYTQPYFGKAAGAALLFFNHMTLHCFQMCPVMLVLGS